MEVLPMKNILKILNTCVLSTLLLMGCAHAMPNDVATEVATIPLDEKTLAEYRLMAKSEQKAYEVISASKGYNQAQIAFAYEHLQMLDEMNMSYIYYVRQGHELRSKLLYSIMVKNSRIFLNQV